MGGAICPNVVSRMAEWCIMVYRVALPRASPPPQRQRRRPHPYHTHTSLYKYYTPFSWYILTWCKPNPFIKQRGNLRGDGGGACGPSNFLCASLPPLLTPRRWPHPNHAHTSLHTHYTSLYTYHVSIMHHDTSIIQVLYTIIQVSCTIIQVSYPIVHHLPGTNHPPL